MNPFTGLGLTHAEEEALYGLERIDFEIEQDEQQAIGIGAQQRFATTTWLTFARLRASLRGVMLDVGGRSLKRWQETEKRLE